MRPKVSVLTTTYNHADYLAAAIDSVLMQEADFEIEHLIGEDCSTDSTPIILKTYQDRYPDRINAIIREKNIGGRNNFVDLFTRCRGEYIAILEGDDFWTDPSKLQTQADILDRNPDCSIVFTAADKLFLDGKILPQDDASFEGSTSFTINDLFVRNFIRTCSVMFRNNLFDQFPAWIIPLPAADWPLHVVNAQFGNIQYIPETTAVHRVHPGGVWSSGKLSARRRKSIQIVRAFLHNLDPKFSPQIKDSIIHWHLKIMNAYRVENDIPGMIKYLSSVLTDGDVSLPRFLKLAMTALREAS